MNNNTLASHVKAFADSLSREVNLHGFLLSASGRVLAGGFRQ